MIRGLVAVFLLPPSPHSGFYLRFLLRLGGVVFIFDVNLLSLQSDHSNCSLGVVDIKTKIEFYYEGHILKWKFSRS